MWQPYRLIPRIITVILFISNLMPSHTKVPGQTQKKSLHDKLMPIIQQAHRDKGIHIRTVTVTTQENTHVLPLMGSKTDNGKPSFEITANILKVIRDLEKSAIKSTANLEQRSSAKSAGKSALPRRMSESVINLLQSLASKNGSPNVPSSRKGSKRTKGTHDKAIQDIVRQMVFEEARVSKHKKRNTTGSTVSKKLNVNVLRTLLAQARALAQKKSASTAALGYRLLQSPRSGISEKGLKRTQKPKGRHGKSSKTSKGDGILAALARNVVTNKNIIEKTKKETAKISKKTVKTPKSITLNVNPDLQIIVRHGDTQNAPPTAKIGAKSLVSTARSQVSSSKPRVSDAHVRISTAVSVEPSRKVSPKSGVNAMATQTEVKNKGKRTITKEGSKVGLTKTPTGKTAKVKVVHKETKVFHETPKGPAVHSKSQIETWITPVTENQKSAKNGKDIWTAPSNNWNPGTPQNGPPEPNNVERGRQSIRSDPSTTSEMGHPQGQGFRASPTSRTSSMDVNHRAPAVRGGHRSEPMLQEPQGPATGRRREHVRGVRISQPRGRSQPPDMHIHRRHGPSKQASFSSGSIEPSQNWGPGQRDQLPQGSAPRDFLPQPRRSSDVFAPHSSPLERHSPASGRSSSVSERFMPRDRHPQSVSHDHRPLERSHQANSQPRHNSQQSMPHMRSSTVIAHDVMPRERPTERRLKSGGMTNGFSQTSMRHEPPMERSRSSSRISQSSISEPRFIEKRRQTGRSSNFDPHMDQRTEPSRPSNSMSHNYMAFDPPMERRREPSRPSNSMSQNTMAFEPPMERRREPSRPSNRMSQNSNAFEPQIERRRDPPRERRRQSSVSMAFEPPMERLRDRGRPSSGRSQENHMPYDPPRERRRQSSVSMAFEPPMERLRDRGRPSSGRSQNHMPYDPPRERRRQSSVSTTSGLSRNSMLPERPMEQPRQRSRSSNSMPQDPLQFEPHMERLRQQSSSSHGVSWRSRPREPSVDRRRQHNVHQTPPRRMQQPFVAPVEPSLQLSHSSVVPRDRFAETRKAILPQPAQGLEHVRGPVVGNSPRHAQTSRIRQHPELTRHRDGRIIEASARSNPSGAFRRQQNTVHGTNPASGSKRESISALHAELHNILERMGQPTGHQPPSSNVGQHSSSIAATSNVGPNSGQPSSMAFRHATRTADRVTQQAQRSQPSVVLSPVQQQIQYPRQIVQPTIQHQVPSSNVPQFVQPTFQHQAPPPTNPRHIVQQQNPLQIGQPVTMVQHTVQPTMVMHRPITQPATAPQAMPVIQNVAPSQQVQVQNMVPSRPMQYPQTRPNAVRRPLHSIIPGPQIQQRLLNTLVNQRAPVVSNVNQQQFQSAPVSSIYYAPQMQQIPIHQNAVVLQRPVNIQPQTPIFRNQRIATSTNNARPIQQQTIANQRNVGFQNQHPAAAPPAAHRVTTIQRQPHQTIPNQQIVLNAHQSAAHRSAPVFPAQPQIWRAGQRNAHTVSQMQPGPFRHQQVQQQAPVISQSHQIMQRPPAQAPQSVQTGNHMQPALFTPISSTRVSQPGVIHSNVPVVQQPVNMQHAHMAHRVSSSQVSRIPPHATAVNPHSPVVNSSPATHTFIHPLAAAVNPAVNQIPQFIPANQHGIPQNPSVTQSQHNMQATATLPNRNAGQHTIPGPQRLPQPHRTTSTNREQAQPSFANPRSPSRTRKRPNPQNTATHETQVSVKIKPSNKIVNLHFTVDAGTGQPGQPPRTSNRSRTSGHRGSQAPMTSGSQAPRTSGSQAPRTSGSQAPRTPGRQATMTSGSQGQQIHTPSASAVTGQNPQTNPNAPVPFRRLQRIVDLSVPTGQQPNARGSQPTGTGQTQAVSHNVGRGSIAQQTHIAFQQNSLWKAPSQAAQPQAPAQHHAPANTSRSNQPNIQPAQQARTRASNISVSNQPSIPSAQQTARTRAANRSRSTRPNIPTHLAMNIKPAQHDVRFQMSIHGQNALSVQPGQSPASLHVSPGSVAGSTAGSAGGQRTHANLRNPRTNIV